MASMALRVALLCGLLQEIGAPLSSDPPAQIWPLGNTTFAFDVQNGVDSPHPSTSGCIETGPRYSTLPYASLRLTGKAESYLDLPVIANGNNQGDFSASLVIYVEALQGTIFDYTATTPQAAVIGRVTLRYVSGNPCLEFYDTVTGITLVSHCMPGAFSLNVWTKFYLGFDFSNTQLVIQLSDVEVHKANHVTLTGRRLGIPGTWRIGASSSLQDYSQLSVTCALLFYVKNGDSDLSHCTSFSYPGPAPSCFTLGITAHVFPLFDSAAGYDVLGQRDLRMTGASGCVRTAEKSSSLGRGAMRMDGTFLTSFDIALTSTLVDRAFSLHLYLYFFPGATLGTALHFRSQESGLALTEVKVTFSPSHVTSLFLDPGGGVCLSLQLSVAGQSSGWTLLSVGRQQQVARLSLGSDVTTGALPCAPYSNHVATSNGTLRVGGSLTSREGGVTADVSCLTVMDAVTDSPATEASFQCAAWAAASFPAGTASCSSGNSLDFSIVARHSVPASVTSPLTSLRVRSLLQCAKECGKGDNCRSFALAAATAGGGRECLLYDFLSTENLQASSAFHYYGVVARD